MSAPWLNSLTTSNFIKPTYVNGFLDVSGGDTINRNGNLVLIDGDASFNKRLFVGGDTSLNGNVYMAKNLTIYGSLNVNEYNSSAVINTISTNVFSLSEDLSLNGRILTTGDASLGGRLFVRGDLSLNGILSVPYGSIPKSAIAGGDFGGSYFINTQAKFTSVASEVTMNLDTVTANTLGVAGTLSITKSLGVGVTNPQYQIDLGSGGIGCGRYVQFGPSTSQPVATMTTNIIMGTFNDLLTTIAADTSLNGRLFVSADTSMNGRLLVGSDASLNGRLYVGSGATFAGPVNARGGLTVAGGVNAVGGATFSGGMYAVGGATFSGGMYAAGGATFTSAVFTPAITATGLVTGTNGLTVTGVSTFNNAITGNTISTTGAITAAGLLTASNGLTVTGTTTSSGLITASNGLTVTGTATFNNAITGNTISTTGAITVAGLLTASNGLTVTGTATFNNAITGTTISTTGNISALGFNTSSDYRIKENIKPLSKDITVDGLKPIQYFNTRARKLDIGFLAHEVQEDFPYLVTGCKDGEDLQTLNYIGLVGVLVKEIQELKAKVAHFEKTIEELDKKA